MSPVTELSAPERTEAYRSALSGAWAVRFEDGSPPALAVPLLGRAWVVPQDAEPVRPDPGDVAVLSGGAPYVIADDPATAPDVIIRPGGVCTTRDGQEASTIGSGPAPDRTVLLNGLCTTGTGAMVGTGVAPERLLAALPPLAVVPAGQGPCPVSEAALEDVPGAAGPPGPDAGPDAARRAACLLLPAPAPRSPSGTGRTATWWSGRPYAPGRSGRSTARSRISSSVTIAGGRLSEPLGGPVDPDPVVPGRVRASRGTRRPQLGRSTPVFVPMFRPSRCHGRLKPCI
ncbi:cupin domain-containing protein [Streptomyces sp. NPDC006540]|uniref:cupin domain-containing protein n=1 Tax=Streptomyces sp. NPDC006540 TaxID=3155353 RepID=UPI0033A0FC0F